MTVIPVIVQARMSSTRLPGKVMMPYAGKTFLESCLDRCTKISGISEVIVATTDRADCDDLAALAKQRGFRVVRASQDDVLGRYLMAAREVKADAIVRITSDCPLADPATASAIIAQFCKGDVDLVTTNIPPSWPMGLDVEVFTMAALEQAGQEAVLKNEREHVSTFIRQRPRRFRLANLPCDHEGCAHWRLTLDTPADRDFFLAFERAFPGDITTADWPRIHKFLAAHPELVEINTNEAFRTTDRVFPTNSPLSPSIQ